MCSSDLVSPLHRQAFTPRFNHHIAAAQGRNLPAWMDWRLKGGAPFPDSPVLSVRLDAAGVPEAIVDVGAEPVDHVDFYYALGDKPPPNRYWRRAAADHSPQPRRAALPVVDCWQSLFVFADVHYASGVCLSSNLESRVPGMLGKARATLRPGEPMDPRTIADSWVFARAHTDPSIERTFVRLADDGARKGGLSMNPDVFGAKFEIDLLTHVLGDPQFAGADGDALAFDVAGAFGPEGLRVRVVQNDWTPLAKTFEVLVSPEEITGGWRTVVLPLARFRATSDKTPPTNWRVLDKLHLQGSTAEGASFRLADLRWVKPPAGK